MMHLQQNKSKIQRGQLYYTTSAGDLTLFHEDYFWDKLTQAGVVKKFRKILSHLILALSIEDF